MFIIIIMQIKNMSWPRTMIRVEIQVTLVQVLRTCTCLTVVYSNISLHVVYCPNMYYVMWSAHGYKWNIILYADFIHSLQDVLYRVNKMGLCFSMRTGTFSCEVC